jgi:Endodeoxyribonuclease RusA
MSYSHDELAEILKNPDLSIDANGLIPTANAPRSMPVASTAQTRGNDRVVITTGGRRQGKYNAVSKRHETFKIAYPGSVISENHAFGRNGKQTFMKPEARDWQNDLIFLLSRCDIKDWQLPIKVKISGVFKNQRESCDLQNLKIVYDSIQKVIGIDDRNFHTETEPPVIDKTQEPHLMIIITEI